jgi:group II intron reverse transcriptase/maturase
MSDPNFLVGCWNNIKSKKGSVTPALDEETLDGIDSKWFEEVASSYSNGKFVFSLSRRICIPKPGTKKERPLTIPHPRDKVTQEAMRFLLELIFEPDFRESSHGFRPKRGCLTALNQIRMTFGSSAWFIEGDIEQMYPSVDHSILVNFIRKRVEDQAFIDLLYKYLRTGFKDDKGRYEPMKIGLSQGGVLSPLLSNIYMHSFDVWMEDTLLLKFNKGKRRKANPVYTKMIRSGSAAEAIRKGVRTKAGNDPSFRRMRYVRYADDFLIGIIGSREDCVHLRAEIKEFLAKELNLSLNLDKTKITHAVKNSALFLGYKVHMSDVKRFIIKKDDEGKTRRRVPRPILDAPIARVVERLVTAKFARKGDKGVPTRNGRFIHLSLADLVNHFLSIERGIVNYYSMANNYGRLAARVNYILKYSCALTIASKMRLRTMRKVFSKYGPNLTIKDEKGEVIASYPARKYVRPKRFNIPESLVKKDIVKTLSERIGRGRKDLKGPCTVCGSDKNIEMHHVRKLSKRKRTRTRDWLLDIMIRMNRKQVPLCKSCHVGYHRGKKRI